MRITSMIRSRTPSVVSAPNDFDDDSKDDDTMYLPQLPLTKSNGKDIAEEIQREQEVIMSSNMRQLNKTFSDMCR